jgi:hypothetical protein
MSDKSPKNTDKAARGSALSSKRYKAIMDAYSSVAKELGISTDSDTALEKASPPKPRVVKS